MGKRSKDLFELLMLRHGSAPQQHSRGAEPAGLQRFTDGVSGFFRRLTGRSESRLRFSQPRLPAGFGLISLVVLTGVLGFVLGRVTAPAKGGQDLRVTDPKPQTPQWMPSEKPLGGAPDLDAAREVETLSKYFFVLLHFPDSRRDRASKLAHYLRECGLNSARIRLMESAKPGEHRWATLVYVPQQEQAPEILAKLRSVTPPSFEPLFADHVAKLTIENHLLMKKTD